MKLITKADIIGARIVDIRQTWEMVEGLDHCIDYFVVDRGFSFLVPIAGLPWTTAEVPPASKSLLHDQITGMDRLLMRIFSRNFVKRRRVNKLQNILNHPIQGVYCHRTDPQLGFRYPDDGIIVLEDGSQISNTVVAPHGTGGAGLYYYFASEIGPVSELDDFFDIPLDPEMTEPSLPDFEVKIISDRDDLEWLSLKEGDRKMIFGCWPKDREIMFRYYLMRQWESPFYNEPVTDADRTRLTEKIIHHFSNQGYKVIVDRRRFCPRCNEILDGSDDPAWPGARCSFCGRYVDRHGNAIPPLHR